MRFNIEIINTMIAPKGWKCTSPVYVNMKSPLIFRCPEGHLVESTWEKMRNKLFCPTCAQNVKKKIAHIGGKKKTDAYRILALDQSSNKTGYSIYDGKSLISYGVFETTKDKAPIDRMCELAEWLDSIIAAWHPDEIGIEETQYKPGDGDGHNVFKLLSQVMGVCFIIGRRAGCRVDSVLIPTWRHYCGVKGNKRADQKRSAQLLVKKWHDISVTDDESDAICIGKYFADKHMNKKVTIGNI